MSWVEGEEVVCSANSSLSAQWLPPPHQSAQPNVLAFPPPQGDWAGARVPRGVRWEVGGDGGGAWLPSLGLCLPLLETLSSPLSWKHPPGCKLHLLTVRHQLQPTCGGLLRGRMGEGRRDEPG